MRTTRRLRCLLAVMMTGGALPLSPYRSQAQTFSYTNCDLLAGFRLPGGPSDLVVDLGPAAAFENLPLRSVIAITNLSSTQLSSALPTLNGVLWSVSGAMRGNPAYLQYPLQTIWITSPRPDLLTPGKVWLRKGQFTQGTVAAQIDAMGAGAATYGSLHPAGPNNTSSGIVISSTDPNSYTVLMTSSGLFSGGNFGGTFQGDAENVTPADFSSTGVISRSVLYKLLPGSGTTPNDPGQPLGFFDFRNDGTLTFTAGPAPERTVITSFEVSAGVNTVSFATTNSVYYRLRFTNDPAMPIGNWSTNGGMVIGDGAIHSLQDSSASPARFYSVESY